MLLSGILVRPSYAKALSVTLWLPVHHETTPGKEDVRNSFIECLVTWHMRIATSWVLGMDGPCRPAMCRKSSQQSRMLVEIQTCTRTVQAAVDILIPLT